MEQILWVVAFVLVVSFLSNVSPFLGASYTWLAAVQLNFVGFTLFNFLFIVVISAIGATLAKVAIYYGAFGLKRTLVKNRNIRLIGRVSTTRGFYAVLFVAAILPVFPMDDFIFIGAGATSASLGLMVAVTLWAKFLKSLVEIGLEFSVLRALLPLFGDQPVELTVLFSAIFVVIGIAVYKVDWEELYVKYWKKGRASPPASDKVL